MPTINSGGQTASDQWIADLTQRLNNAGCFKSAQLSYALRCTSIVVALSMAFIGLMVGPDWPLRMALILITAFICVQAAFVAHDIGDGALVTSPRISEVLRQGLLSFACGTSSTYFHHTHRLHHLSLERRGRSGVNQSYVKNRYELFWMKRLLAWNGRVFMIGTIALRGFTFRIESIRFVIANRTSTRMDQVVLLAHYVLWIALPASVLGFETALVNLGLITLLAGSYIGTVLILNHEGMSGVEEVSELAPFQKVLATTRNLSGNRMADILLGSVNNHIEHHLFPDLPTMHLPKARVIVEDFCRELGLTYVETGVAEALHSADRHFRNAGRQRLVAEALS